MAIIINPNEVLLNSIRYPLIGLVRPMLVSQFPQKLVIGDYSKESEHTLSTWITSDLRGGILVEEMDESTDQDRAWWATADIAYKGHFVQPPAVTDCGSGGLSGVYPRFLIEYANEVYAALGTRVRKLDNANSDFNDGICHQIEDCKDTWDLYENSNMTQSVVTTTTVNDEDLTQTAPFNCTLVDDPLTPSHLYLVITDANASISAFTIKITGTDKDSAAYTETFLFAGGLTQTSRKEFKTITKVEIRDITGAAAADTLAITSLCLKFQVDTAIVGEMLAWETISEDLTSYHNIRARIKSELAAAAGDLQLLVSSGETWVTPTSSNDPTPGWDDDDNIWDDDTATKAQSTASLVNGAWSPYLESLHAALDCNRVRFYCSSGGTTLTIDLDVYYGSAWHDVYEGVYTASTWTTKYIPGGAQSVTKIRIRQRHAAPGATKEYMHEVDFGQTTTATLDVPALTADTWAEVTVALPTPANLGSVVAIGLKQVTDLGAEPYDIHLTNVRAYDYDLPANPTDAWVYQVNGADQLFMACDNQYVIFNGITVSEQSADALYFAKWDSKLWKIDYTGQAAYSTNGTSWTNKAKLTIPNNSVNSLFEYRDADGNFIIYAGTQEGLSAQDYANTKFIATDLALPTHPNACVKPGLWRGACYVPAGLDVLKYVVAATASITSVGLNRRDGLPAEYQGEIRAIIEGYNDIYALVDSTYGSGSTYSSIQAYDGAAWRCIWASGTANKEFECAVVSSAYDSYRLYFGTDDKVYHIDIQRTLRNPLKVLGYSYQTSSLAISPWFDGGWANLDKLAVEAEIYGRSMSATETAILKYRLNHLYTDIATGWTTLGTVTTNAKTTYPFGSSLGQTFNALQWRLDLASGSSSVTPDIQWVALKYLKLLPPAWGWTCTVNCSQALGGLSRTQLIDNLVAAVESQTLLPFTFKNRSGSPETKYVKVKSVVGLEQTGEDNFGQFTIQLIEV